MSRLEEAAPGWLLDELAHAGGEHLDPAYVATYDGKAGTDPADDLAVLRELGLGRGSGSGFGFGEGGTLVDLGAGTGALALAAAPLCRRVVAVDVSPAMLAVVRARAVERGLGNVECVRAGFLTYAHEGDPADFVYSRHALHHLPDFWKAVALARVAAMLRPGGVLLLRDLVYAFEPAEAGPVIESWVAGGAARPEEGWTRAELETHVREEHSTFDWLLRPMLAHAGFEVREASVSPSRTYAIYTCVRV